MHIMEQIANCDFPYYWGSFRTNYAVGIGRAIIQQVGYCQAEHVRNSFNGIDFLFACLLACVFVCLLAFVNIPPTFWEFYALHLSSVIIAIRPINLSYSGNLMSGRKSYIVQDTRFLPVSMSSNYS
jgi:hypothetical protein